MPTCFLEQAEAVRRYYAAFPALKKGQESPPLYYLPPPAWCSKSALYRKVTMQNELAASDDCNAKNKKYPTGKERRNSYHGPRKNKKRCNSHNRSFESKESLPEWFTHEGVWDIETQDPVKDFIRALAMDEGYGTCENTVTDEVKEITRAKSPSMRENVVPDLDDSLDFNADWMVIEDPVPKHSSPVDREVYAKFQAKFDRSIEALWSKDQNTPDDEYQDLPIDFHDLLSSPSDQLFAEPPVEKRNTILFSDSIWSNGRVLNHFMDPVESSRFKDPPHLDGFSAFFEHFKYSAPANYAVPKQSIEISRPTFHPPPTFYSISPFDPLPTYRSPSPPSPPSPPPPPPPPPPSNSSRKLRLPTSFDSPTMFLSPSPPPYIDDKCLKWLGDFNLLTYDFPPNDGRLSIFSLIQSSYTAAYAPVIKPTKSAKISEGEPTEDLLTSERTHFRPIRRLSDSDDARRYPDGHQFDIDGEPDTVQFTRSDSGGMYLDGERYQEYRTGTTIDYSRLKLTEAQRCPDLEDRGFRLRFPVRQINVAVQTDPEPEPAPDRIRRKTVGRCGDCGRYRKDRKSGDVSRVWCEPRDCPSCIVVPPRRRKNEKKKAKSETVRSESLERYSCEFLEMFDPIRLDRRPARRQQKGAPGVLAAADADEGPKRRRCDRGGGCRHPHAPFLHCDDIPGERPLTR